MMPDLDALDKIEEDLQAWRREHPHSLGAVYVPGEGTGRPLAMVIGEAPGAQEEIAQRPFVGPAGTVLRELMATAGLYVTDWEDQDRCEYGVGNCWLTNVIKFRPPRNRTPFPSEIKANSPFLIREWKSIGRPRIIICVGGTAYRAITMRSVPILRSSGRCYTFQSHTDGQQMVMWPMIHPSYGLRNENARETIEADWLRLGEWFTNWQQRRETREWGII